jgi:hypothetical protein
MELSEGNRVIAKTTYLDFAAMDHGGREIPVWMIGHRLTEQRVQASQCVNVVATPILFEMRPLRPPRIVRTLSRETEPHRLMSDDTSRRMQQELLPTISIRCRP